MSAKKKQSVSLVLGSGGARGLAHIGVIHELEASGYDIRSLSSCSMGALVGGVYAAGKLDELERWLRAIDKLDIVTLLDISWRKSGFVKGDKIIHTLIELVGAVTIEELPIPFTAVASDVEGEKEVWLNSGPLFDAIRASISLPLFFTPVPFKGGHLIDGGILNPVPIAPTFNDDTDITIAVNLGGPAEAQNPVVNEPAPQDEDSWKLHRNIKRFVEDLQSAWTEDDEDDWDMYEVADKAFDAMQSTIARQKLAAYPPDLVIELPRNACGTLEFDRAAEMIDLGHERARAALDRG